MSSFDKKLTTKEKALQLNLDSSIYGTIAEIGGGQEVAAYFFRAGAASGTIAKTMSAYDMTFSDAIYGKCKRYVSKEKLMLMLEREYSLLNQRLTQRAKKTKFFAYANTVEVINYGGTNVGHGWMGIRFQRHPGLPPNDCIIHLALKDPYTEWQQDLLGIVGVNLIHCCYHCNTPDEIINALADNIRQGRFEIDMISLSGPDFPHVDNRILTLKLVKNGFTKAAMFGPDGEVHLLSDKLYRQNTLVMRGRFRPVTYVNVDMMIKGMREFKQEIGDEKLEQVVEITLKDLTREGVLDEQDYIDRVELLCSLGQHVLISNYHEHYKLSNYLCKFVKNKKLALIVGLNNLSQIFDEKYYSNLDGGILESFSRLFKSNVKLYVYPALDPVTGRLKTIDEFQPAPHLKDLFDYFVAIKRIVPIPDPRIEHLHITSDEVVKMIANGSGEWEEMVPNRVVSAIKENHLFNYPYEIQMDDENFN